MIAVGIIVGIVYCLPPAEYEREMIRERVVAGLRKAKASGKHVGRPMTFALDISSQFV